MSMTPERLEQLRLLARLSTNLLDLRAALQEALDAIPPPGKPGSARAELLALADELEQDAADIPWDRAKAERFDTAEEVARRLRALATRRT